jgi:hypothetical protein
MTRTLFAARGCLRDAAVPERGRHGCLREDGVAGLGRASRVWRPSADEALQQLDARRVELDEELLANVNTERDLDRLRALAT